MIIFLKHKSGSTYLLLKTFLLRIEYKFPIMDCTVYIIWPLTIILTASLSTHLNHDPATLILLFFKQAFFRPSALILLCLLLRPYFQWLVPSHLSSLCSDAHTHTYTRLPHLSHNFVVFLHSAYHDMIWCNNISLCEYLLTISFLIRILRNFCVLYIPGISDTFKCLSKRHSVNIF